MRWSILFLMILTLAPIIEAAEFLVPSEYPTIQAGIDAASAGDTVLIACGTYQEHDIAMKSGVCLRSETGTPDCVWLDAQSLGRVIVCTLVDEQASIEGLTLLNGRSGDADQGVPPPGYGAGILCVASSPSFRACCIQNCYAETGGAGICLLENSNPLIEDCRFEANTAEDYGGGLMADWSSPSIISSNFIGNVSNNLGGAVSCMFSTLDFVDCTFSYNEAMLGGGLRVQDASVHLSGCTLAWNSAQSGGGFYLRSEPYVELSNTIIAFSREGGTIVCGYDCDPPTLLCCDLFGNEGGDWTGLFGEQLGVNGNICVDPIFCGHFGGEDFTLRSDSPCAGENNPECGQIGAWSIGCGGTATEIKSWSAVKVLY